MLRNIRVWDAARPESHEVWSWLFDILKEYSIVLEDSRNINQYDKLPPYNPNFLSNLNKNVGNLAICFVSNKIFIAPSQNNINKISAAYRSVHEKFKHGIFLGIEDDLFSVNYDDKNHLDIRLFQRVLAEDVVANSFRKFDSERIILNSICSLDIDIEDVFILTEKIPCDSCIKAMIDFMKINLDCKLHIGYFMNTKNSYSNNVRDISTLSDELKAYSCLSDRLTFNLLYYDKERNCLETGRQIMYDTWIAGKPARLTNYKDIDKPEFWEEDKVFGGLIYKK